MNKQAKLIFFVALLLVASATTIIHHNTPEIVIKAIERQKQGNKTQTNISSIAEEYIPPGTPIKIGESFLKNNGFNYSNVEYENRRSIIGSRKERYWRYAGLYYEEIRIILFTEGDTINKTEAWIFFDGL
ncbi:MAG: hypothetical protein Q4E06_11795 [Lautropia sp.]|nr:hypothetical protein [Lautropia sp.]